MATKPTGTPDLQIKNLKITASRVEYELEHKAVIEEWRVPSGSTFDIGSLGDGSGSWEVWTEDISKDGRKRNYDWVYAERVRPTPMMRNQKDKIARELASESAEMFGKLFSMKSAYDTSPRHQVKAMQDQLNAELSRLTKLKLMTFDQLQVYLELSGVTELAMWGENKVALPGNDHWTEIVE